MTDHRAEADKLLAGKPTVDAIEQAKVHAILAGAEELRIRNLLDLGATAPSFRAIDEAARRLRVPLDSQ